MGASDISEWRVIARHDMQQLPVSVTCRGVRVGEVGTSAAVGAMAPMEYLLASVATCFALSCQAVLAARKVEAPPFAVDVRGVKAADKPSRLAQVSVQIDWPEEFDAVLASRIAADAKRICTVSNSMVLGTPFEVGTGVLNGAESLTDR